jgi:hypothetical protein
MNKREFLDKLFYLYGKQNTDFYLNIMTKEGDIVKSTKWRKYSDVCWSNNNKDIWFLEKVNNRSILKNEVVLDLEEAERVNEITEKLKKLNLYFSLFKTGSRGYHYHLFFNRELIKEEKLYLIKYFKCDEQKAGDKCMIALEYSPHWKSGKVKSLVEENKGINYLH